jgi:hypothetical protein
MNLKDRISRIIAIGQEEPEKESVEIAFPSDEDESHQVIDPVKNNKKYMDNKEYLPSDEYLQDLANKDALKAEDIRKDLTNMFASKENIDYDVIKEKLLEASRYNIAVEIFIYNSLLNNPDFYFNNKIYNYKPGIGEQAGYISIRKVIGQITRKEITINDNIERLLYILLLNEDFKKFANINFKDITPSKIADMLADIYPDLFLKMKLDQNYHGAYEFFILKSSPRDVDEFNDVQKELNRIKLLEKNSGRDDVLSEFVEMYYSKNFVFKFKKDIANHSLLDGTTNDVINNVVDNYLNYSNGKLTEQNMSTMNHILNDQKFLTEMKEVPSFKNRIKQFYDVFNKEVSSSKRVLKELFNNYISEENKFIKNTINLMNFYPDLKNDCLFEAINNLKTPEIVYRMSDLFSTDDVMNAAFSLARKDIIAYLKDLTAVKSDEEFEKKFIGEESSIKLINDMERKDNVATIFHLYIRTEKVYEAIINKFPYLKDIFRESVKGYVSRNASEILTYYPHKAEELMDDDELRNIVISQIYNGNLNQTELLNIISANKDLNAKQRNLIVRPAAEQLIRKIWDYPNYLNTFFTSGAYLYSEEEDVEDLLNHWFEKFNKVFDISLSDVKAKSIKYPILRKVLSEKENLNKLLESKNYELFYDQEIFLGHIDKDIIRKFAEKLAKENPIKFLKDIHNTAYIEKIKEIALEFSKLPIDEQEERRADVQKKISELSEPYVLTKEYPDLTIIAIKQYIKKYYPDINIIRGLLLDLNISLYKDDKIKKIVIEEYINNATNSQRIRSLGHLLFDELLNKKQYPDLHRAVAEKISIDPHLFVEHNLDKEYPDIKYCTAEYFQNIDDYKKALQNVDNIRNDLELETPKNFNIRLDQFADYQRTKFFEKNDIQRFCFSFSASAPTKELYDINKKLVHAGDMINHTNVGISGFTSCWGLISFLPNDINNRDNNDLKKNEIILEQYQSDYPVMLNKIFLGKIKPDDVSEYFKLTSSPMGTGNYIDKTKEWMKKYKEDNNTPMMRPLNEWIKNNADVEKVREYFSTLEGSYTIFGRTITYKEVSQNKSDEAVMQALDFYKESLDYDKSLPISLSENLDDARKYIAVISNVYPYLVLKGLIEFAMQNKKDYIYILATAGEVSNILNKEKADFLYREIPEFLGGTIITFENGGDDLYWKISATKENMDKIKEKIGEDKNYDFSLTPEQNKKVADKAREKAKQEERDWKPSEEKSNKLINIIGEIKEKLPGQEIPTLNTPIDVMKFLNEDVKGKMMTKTKFFGEFSKIMQELGKISRAYLLQQYLKKIGYYVPGDSKMPQPIKQNPDYGMDFITRLKKRKKKLKKMKKKSNIESFVLRIASEEQDEDKVDLINTDLQNIEEDWDVEMEEERQKRIDDKDITRILYNHNKEEDASWQEWKDIGEQNKVFRDKITEEKKTEEEYQAFKRHHQWLELCDEATSNTDLKSSKFILTNIDILNSFVDKHGGKIPKFVGYGAYGTVFELGDKTMLKIYETSDFNDTVPHYKNDYYDISQKIIFNDMPGASLELYPISHGEFNEGTKYVIMEKFETSTILEDKHNIDLSFITKLALTIKEMIQLANSLKYAGDIDEDDDEFIELQSILSDDSLSKKIIKLLGEKIKDKPNFYRDSNELNNYKIAAKLIAKSLKESGDIVPLNAINKIDKTPGISHDWLANLILQIIHKLKTERIDLVDHNVGLRPSTGYFVFFDA